MSIGIGLGIVGFPFASPRDFLAWIDLCEDSGVDSVWVTDRLISSSPMLEPLSAFGVIAGRTERLKFGMNAIVLPLRDPLVVAKECATLDFLSNGRLLTAFGVGSELAPEYRGTNRAFKGRGRQADEMLQIMSRLWAGERLTFAGEFYQYTDVVISPLPEQQPLPLWIGGSSDAAVRRTALYGTGWLGGIQSPAMVKPVVARIRAAAAEAGRPIDDDHYGAGFPFRFGSMDEPVVQRQAAGLARVGEGLDPASYMAVGDAGAISARIEEYIAAGVSKFVARPIADNETDMALQTQRLVEDVLPRFRGR
jgi:probable F420-dependent oxidoreductase